MDPRRSGFSLCSMYGACSSQRERLHGGERSLVWRAPSMRKTAYRRYLLAVLLVVLALNLSDRLALGLALQNIKSELRLSDTQLGLLTGIAFTFFHAVMGVPIARWADRGNRVRIITLTLALCSVMVAITGKVANFVQLLGVRSAVAVGEAGCMPVANSLIADYFVRSERPRASGIYLTGGYLSVVIGYFLGGWFNQFYGWRVMFMLLGIPGLVLAVLVRGTLREPRLDAAKGGGRNSEAKVGCTEAGAFRPGTPSSPQLLTDASGEAPNLREVFAVLWSNRTFRHLVCFLSIGSLFGTGIGQWQATYFIRSYGLSTGQLGTWFAVVSGLMGFVGVNLGGILATRYAPNDEAAQFRAMAIISSVLALVWSGIYFAHNYYVSFCFMGLGTLGFAMFSGPIFGAVQSLVPTRMRAMAAATLTLFSNLIGGGVGPLVAGAMSDALHGAFGAESLRWALLALCPGYIWAGWYLWRASKTVSGDIDALRVGESCIRARHCLNGVAGA